MTVACFDFRFWLLVSYKELNLLLSKIASSAGKTDIPLMPITNFYGIESNPFSCAIARMGLLFVVLQSKEASLSTIKTNIDILFSNSIVTANPTRIPWDSVCPGTSETYIIGKEFDKTYAQMYKKDEMSDDLRFAHSMLDLQIERCYRDEPFVSDDAAI